MDVERANLLAIARALIRDVIKMTNEEKRIVFGASQNSDGNSEKTGTHAELLIQMLLTVIEHCLCHGLRKEFPSLDALPNQSETASSLEVFRNSASALRRAKDQVIQTANNILAAPRSMPNPWPVVLHMEQCHPVSEKLSTKVQSLSEVRTGLGKTRVWIRYALMHKISKASAPSRIPSPGWGSCRELSSHGQNSGGGGVAAM
ncbi:unnamed protein product [Echinostoma caproni]|uniref:RUN domain-containing protein n=1 Tax=Echinostoma caproni TaxID=27848 RepID=A0A183BFA2_9TREM|nr:unnamed protein product [Echinostoma caproni]